MEAEGLVEREFYTVGEPLSREGLFQLMTDEAFKDGRIEDWENSVLNTLRKFLGIAGDRARKIAARSRKKFEAGELGGARPFHALQLYERALFFVWSDGRLDEAEAKMLQGLRIFFKISSKTHDELLRRVRQPGYSERTHPELKPYTPRLAPAGRGRILVDSALNVLDTFPDMPVEDGSAPGEESAETGASGEAVVADSGSAGTGVDGEADTAGGPSTAGQAGNSDGSRGDDAMDDVEGSPVEDGAVPVDDEVDLKTSAGRMGERDFDNLVSEMRELFQRQAAGGLDDDDERRILDCAAGISVTYEKRPERRNAVLTVVPHLAAVMARVGRLGDLAGLLQMIQAVDDRWDRRPEYFQATLTAVVTSLDERKPGETVTEALELGWDLVSHGAGEEYRWSALADMCRRGAALLAARGEWERHERVLSYFSRVPDGLLEATAPDWAVTLEAWIGDVCAGGRPREAWKALESFLRLTSFFHSRDVRQTYASSLSKVLSCYGDGGLEYDSDFTALLEDLIELVSSFLADTEVSMALVRCLPGVLPVLDTSSDEGRGLFDSLGVSLSKVTGRHGANESFGLELCRSLEGAARRLQVHRTGVDDDGPDGALSPGLRMKWDILLRIAGEAEARAGAGEASKGIRVKIERMANQRES